MKDIIEKLVTLYIKANEMAVNIDNFDTSDFTEICHEFDGGVYDQELFRQAIKENVIEDDPSCEQVEMNL